MSPPKIKRVVPIGEIQIGPGQTIHFESRPVAAPNTTVDVVFGPTLLRVRVSDRQQMQSHGSILMTRKLPCRRLKRGFCSVDQILSGEIAIVL